MEENKFVKHELEMLKFWEDNNCFEKLQNKNKGRKAYRIVDGPITANNSMRLHHCWGRTVKDVYIKYKSMNGYSCHYRNGFDGQGLWVEVEVEKELGFKGKKDIINYGMDKFTQACVDRVNKFSKVITGQSKRLGQWMDWNNSYYTHTDQNIQGIWHFLKVCNEKGWLTQADKPMPWCPRCGTSLSEHEMSGSYKEVEHESVFVKAKVVEEDFDMLVWTTTPWTLTANVALAINPELEYVKIVYDGGKRPLVLAKNALSHIKMNREVVDKFKGEKLLGLHFETFFPELPCQQGVEHKIIAWSDVLADEGSGVVHIAPGCGAEDFELGQKNNLPSICPIDENGDLLDNYGVFSNIYAGDVANLVFEELKKQDKFFMTEMHTHKYPICWRCKTQVFFRLVREWFIKTDEIKPQLLQAIKTVKWSPEYAEKRMEDWLNNMGDWNISRSRFYGLPLPFYACSHCGHTTVVGSKEELEKLSGQDLSNLKELHRPYVDDIKIKCPHCGELVERVKQVGDVWLDAGITPFTTLGYFENKEEWEKQFPAEVVIEMREQIRLWFYSMLFMSVTLTGRAPYEKVVSYGAVVAEDGSKFSKSSGNSIHFEEVAEQLGADAVRYLFAGASTINDVRFSMSLCEEARRKMLQYYNAFTFFDTYANIDKPKCNVTYPSEELYLLNISTLKNPLDKWLYSRVNLFANFAKNCYDNHDTVNIVKEFEKCMDDIANFYIRINRRRFWKDGFEQDKEDAYNSLYYALKTITQVMSPIIPFMTEYIWQNLVKKYGQAEESVFLSDFPKNLHVENAILEESEKVRDIITNALSLRNQAQIKVKQPLKTLYIDSEYQQVCKSFEDVIKSELNVKEIVYLNDFNTLCKEKLHINFKVAGAKLKNRINDAKNFVENLDLDECELILNDIRQNGSKNLGDFDVAFELDMFDIEKVFNENIVATLEDIKVAIDISTSEELEKEGILREILRGLQIMRKDAGYDVADRVILDLTTTDDLLSEIIEEEKENIQNETLSTITKLDNFDLERELNIRDRKLNVKISK